MKQCLILEIGLPYVNFKTIGDYVILMSYYLKLLRIPKTELNVFVRNFEKIVAEYRNSVNAKVVAKVIHPDMISRMDILKEYF